MQARESFAGITGTLTDSPHLDAREPRSSRVTSVDPGTNQGVNPIIGVSCSISRQANFCASTAVLRLQALADEVGGSAPRNRGLGRLDLSRFGSTELPIAARDSRDAWTFAAESAPRLDRSVPDQRLEGFGLEPPSATQLWRSLHYLRYTQKANLAHFAPSPTVGAGCLFDA